MARADEIGNGLIPIEARLTDNSLTAWGAGLNMLSQSQAVARQIRLWRTGGSGTRGESRRQASRVSLSTRTRQLTSEAAERPRQLVWRKAFFNGS